MAGRTEKRDEEHQKLFGTPGLSSALHNSIRRSIYRTLEKIAGHLLFALLQDIALPSVKLVQSLRSIKEWQ